MVIQINIRCGYSLGEFISNTKFLVKIYDSGTIQPGKGSLFVFTLANVMSSFLFSETCMLFSQICTITNGTLNVNNSRGRRAAIK